MKSIKSAEVELNTVPFKTEKSSILLDKMGFTSIEATSLDLNQEICSIENPKIQNVNYFLYTLQLAFTQHKSIYLSPDMFWLLICQGISKHINHNTEFFRTHFNLAQEKKTIEVRRDEFIKGGKNDWENIFPDFSKKINEYIGNELYTDFVLHFSTTTSKETTAFEIAFMDSFSKFFDYRIYTLCGIPEIKLQGTVEDYQKIIQSLKNFNKIGLEKWANVLIPIFYTIISSLNGKENYKFWNSIYKYHSGSGGTHISGWITSFFPYIKETYLIDNSSIDKIESFLNTNNYLKILSNQLSTEYDRYNEIKLIKLNPVLGERDYSLELDCFSLGLNRVPFIWNYFGKLFEMNFVSGFIGIQEIDNVLKTEIHWIIEEKK